MPTDDPYDLDFFQRVVNCQWEGTGNWMMAELFIIAPANVPHYRMSIRSNKEGGPILVRAVDGVVTPPAMHAFNFGSSDLSYIITDADLKFKNFPNAQFRQGFNIAYTSSGGNQPLRAQTLVNLSKEQKPFKLSLEREDTSPIWWSNMALVIYLAKAKDVKAGLATFQIPWFAQRAMDLSNTSLFTIDPKKLTITVD